MYLSTLFQSQVQRRSQRLHSESCGLFLRRNTENKKLGLVSMRQQIKRRVHLKGLSDEEGYETFVVPDDVGGRFSVLTAVGLLPIAVAGIDIRELMKRLQKTPVHSMKAFRCAKSCYQYAAVRNCLLRSGYSTEIMVNYEPSFHYMTEWWKQLFGESEGKDGRGIFPAGVDNTTDLHSMGQYIQDGQRILFETVVQIDKARRSFEIPNDKDNLDGLNFLSGMDMNEVNQKALQGCSCACRRKSSEYDYSYPRIDTLLGRTDDLLFRESMWDFRVSSGGLTWLNPTWRRSL